MFLRIPRGSGFDWEDGRPPVIRMRTVKGSLQSAGYQHRVKGSADPRNRDGLGDVEIRDGARDLACGLIRALRLYLSATAMPQGNLFGRRLLCPLTPGTQTVLQVTAPDIG